MKHKLWILLSILVLGVFFWFFYQKKLKTDPANHIVSIIQTGPEKEALKTTYLAELLGLSVDQPTNIYVFDKKEGEKRLLSCPLIEKAEIKKIPPSSLYIDYTVRRPVAWLGDYENIAIDKEGFLFPIFPYLSPKQLPEIILGLPPFASEEDGTGRKGGAWHEKLSNKYFTLALDLLEMLSEPSWKNSFRLLRIDVSHAFEESYGRKEIVLWIEDEVVVRKGKKGVLCIFPKILRLSVAGFSKQLGNFLALREKMLMDYQKQIVITDKTEEVIRFRSKVIDLRLDEIAFIDEN